jgi:hypothetical protein
LALLLLAGSSALQARSGDDLDRILARARRLTEAAPPCPVRRDDSADITVCARDHADRFRIPKVIRDEPQPRKAGAATAWGTRTIDSEESARAGRPDSSSPDGSGGQGGLNKKVHREWERERQMIEARRPRGR